MGEQVATGGRTTFGLFVTHVYPQGEDFGARLAEHREQVALMRDVGFTSVAVGQHFLTRPLQIPAMVPYLTNLAEVSGQMRLVFGVALLPLLNPILLAEDIATLDWLSGGRVVLGLAPAVSVEVRAGFLFDVPVRFAEDRLDVTGAAFAAGEAPSVPLIEVRETPA